MTSTKGICRVCQRVVSAEQVDHPFGNVRLNDHYVYEGQQKKLCEGNGRMAQPVRAEERKEEKSPFEIPEVTLRRCKFKLFELE